MSRPTTEAEDTERNYDGPSRSRLKRERQAIHDFGRELVELPDKHLARVALPEDLATAVRDARGLAKGARKRQLKFLAGLLADCENLDAIRQSLHSVIQPQREQVERFHQVERWRDRLLDDGDSAIEDFLLDCPAAERQTLRQLVRNALKEREQQKPPRAARVLFNTLSDLLNRVG